MSLPALIFFAVVLLLKPCSSLYRWRSNLASMFFIPIVTFAMPIYFIYSFSNVQDVTWGNRPTLTDYTPRQGKQFETKEDSTKL